MTFELFGETPDEEKRPNDLFLFIFPSKYKLGTVSFSSSFLQKIFRKSKEMKLIPAIVGATAAASA